MSTPNKNPEHAPPTTTPAGTATTSTITRRNKPARTQAQSTARTLTGTGVGNALEWFDWNVYATFAVFFSTQIFDKSDPSSAFFHTMAVFAVGFVARPFGGFFFGWLADHIGRKHSLSVAVFAASLGSLIIAITPTYNQVGWVASAILVFARLIQGLAHGGELPAAQTYLSEHAPRGSRGLWASSIYITGTLGMLVGMILGLTLETTLNDAQMASWGWRIPFAIGAVLGVFAWWMRMNMEETEVFEAAKAARKADSHTKRPSVLLGVIRNWRTALQVIGMTCGLTVCYYVWSVTMPSLAQRSYGYTPRDAFLGTIIGNIVFIIALPIWGAISDRIGRKPCMLIAMIGCSILYIPLNNWVESSHSVAALWVSISVMLILLAAFLGHAPATYAEMFSTGQRASGFGIPYALAIAAFGGTAAAVMAKMDNNLHFAFYSIGLMIISSLTILTLPETKGIDLHKEH